MNQIMHSLIFFRGPGLVVLLIVLSFSITRYFFNITGQDNQKSIITYQFIYALIILSVTLALVISLPIEQSIKSQIISLIGIVLSAAFALSSTTLISTTVSLGYDLNKSRVLKKKIN